MDFAELKKKHGLIFFAQIAEWEVVFRVLTWQEYDIYVKLISTGLIDTSAAYHQIFRETCLNPTLVDQMNLTPAGLVPTMSQAILILSGQLLDNENDLDKLNSDIDEIRDHFSRNPFEQIKALICQAFPGHTPSSLEKLPYYEVLRMGVMAEAILQKPGALTFKTQKETSLYNKVFEDARQAQHAENSFPKDNNLKRMLSEKQGHQNKALEESILRARADRARQLNYGR